VYLYIHTHTHTYIYIYIHTHTHTYVHTYTCTQMYVYGSIGYSNRLLADLMSVRPPLWSIDQSSWLEIQMPGFDSRHYQIFSEVVGPERGPLSLVSTNEELFASFGASVH
jgi:hypothetical protein